MLTGPLQREPFLPRVGELFLVRTVLFWSPDQHDNRPVVVFEVPPGQFDQIAIVTRTTQKGVPGIWHDRQPSLGLSQPGTFSRYARVERASWTPDNVRLLGRLDPETLRKVLGRFA